MQNINCDVTNCSHNNSGSCYADRVNIGGDGASVEKGTCCGSFLDSRLYSTLTNSTMGGRGSNELVCKAEKCNYNKNKLCTLESIQVSGGPSNIYTETYCASFEE